MVAIERFFQNTADAVVGIDRSQKVRFWNKASERLFGLSFEQVKGRNCYEIVAGSELSGCALCSTDCILFKRLLKGESIPDYDLVVKGRESEPAMVNVSAVLVPEARRTKTRPIAFLLIRRVDSHRLIKRLAAESRIGSENAHPGKHDLTSREREILELAANGGRTSLIARQLSISEPTVRNHFRKVFAKLGVHTRAEAVSLALRHNFF